MSPQNCLLDTGPLVALLNQGDQDHERARSLAEQFPSHFMTCEAVITETCFLMSKISAEGPEEVIKLGQKGFYEIAFSLKDQHSSIETLLRKYKDQPISLADACLIRCAELYQEPRILTFDSDFEVYRWGRNKRFTILK